MKIDTIKTIDFATIYQVMTSSSISDKQKEQFIRTNRIAFKKVMESNITSNEFKTIMKTRAIQKFRPFKNSFTKQGDKRILAEALSLPVAEIPSYIKSVTESLNKLDELDFLPTDKLEMVKTYVYRHGSKDEVVSFLDYELRKTRDLLKTLHSTLEYYNGGVADYFMRPIHRMDNKTMLKIYNVVNNHIESAKKNGDFDEVHSEKIAKWALIQIYRIKNNSKFINAIKTYNELH